MAMQRGFRKLVLGHSRVTRAKCFSSARQPNWLEENCGAVPTHPRPLDVDTSQMLRGGHALQVANAKLLDGQLSCAARRGALSYSESHKQTLQEMKELEEKALKRIEKTVNEQGLRFRPSLVLPAVHCSSLIVGSVLSNFGESVSTSYLKGVKIAISDYYNDQIREIYERKEDQTELKELFKVSRDEELQFVDAHSQDVLDPNKEDEDPVTTFAKTSTKVLLRVAEVI